MIDVGPVKASPLPFGTDYPRRGGVSVEIRRNAEPFHAAIVLDVIASAAARKIELVPQPADPGAYFALTILLPDGTSVRVHGSDRWGYAASLYDEHGKYLIGASKFDAEQRRQEREAARR